MSTPEKPLAPSVPYRVGYGLGRGLGRDADHPADPAPDHLRDDIREALSRDASIDVTDVEVGVTDGAVTLTGSVPSLEMRGRAVELVRQVRGVTSVNSALTVQGS